MPGPVADLGAAINQLLGQLGALNGYLYAAFHPNLVVKALIENTIVQLDNIWFGFILQTTDMGSSGAPFVGNATIQQFEPKVQIVADATLALIAIWSAYRIMWGHGLFTQYTARILLPRLFMAAVLINFPLMLFQFAVDASNTISKAVVNEIQLDKPSVLIPGFVPADPLQIITIAALAAAFDVFAVVYILRYAILILLAITAPIAGLLFMLPETNHISKLWISHFTTNLFMQPIQLFVMAIGFGLEHDGVTPIHHVFALASLLIVFKVPGAMGGGEKAAHKLESTLHSAMEHVVKAVAKA